MTFLKGIYLHLQSTSAQPKSLCFPEKHNININANSSFLRANQNRYTT